MYNPLQIAYIILGIAAKRSIYLTPFQLIRVVYIVYVIYKVSKQKQLFKGSPKQWSFSKIISELWKAFRPFGIGPIKGAIGKKYRISRTDINFFEFLFDRHIKSNLKKLKTSRVKPLIEKIKKELDL